MFVSMVIGVFSGAPIAFVLGTVSVFFGIIGWGPGCFSMFVLRLWGVLTDFTLVAVPLFVFMGFVLEKSGLAEDLYDSMEILWGPVRGGLAIGTIFLCTRVFFQHLYIQDILPLSYSFSHTSLCMLGCRNNVREHGYALSFRISDLFYQPYRSPCFTPI